MPRVEDGWVLVPLERLGFPLGWAVGCGCVLVDEPFTAIVEAGGERLSVAVGSGSLVCPPGCVEDGLRLAAPAWARGVVLRRGPCPYTGDAGLAERLGGVTGLELVEADAARVLGEGGLALLPGGLDVEPLEGGCGELEAMLPTHPLGAAAAMAGRACVKRVVRPVRGGKWWGGVPLARLRRGPVLAYRFGVVQGDRPEALLYTGEPGENGDRLLLAYALGALHACGAREA